MRTDKRNKSRDELAQSMPWKEEEDQRTTKKTSMKRAFILFWQGLTSLLVGIANWFTVVLGMKDNSKYGKFLRRVVGTCFAFLVLMVTIVASMIFYEELCGKLKCNSHSDDSNHFDDNPQYVSRTVSYYGYYGGEGFLKTSDGKKTITGVRWIAKPLGMDSLVCYSNGEKRGYFNKFTGMPVIKPKYNHAWRFSDGLASVDDDGWIKFIDASGKVAIDLRIPYLPNTEGYVFHNGYCIINHKRHDLFGLIDKQGKWVLEPEYSNIESVNKWWIVRKEDKTSVLDSALNTVIPFTKGIITVNDEFIAIIRRNHTIQHYNHNGELIHDSYITDVKSMTYQTDELLYTITRHYNEEGTLINETDNSSPIPMQKTAKCLKYEADCGWYGLMNKDGKTITPPSYISINAIGYDLYLCKDLTEDGIILNGKGEPVK